MNSRTVKLFSAVVAAMAIPSASSAMVTYHFTQATTAYNSGTGILRGLTGPITLDFTIANALGANGSYSFGVAGVENVGPNLVDLRISAGTALTTFTLADFHGRYEYFGHDAGHSLSRLGVTTDAAGKINFFDISFRGRSTVDPTLIFAYTTQKNPGNIGVYGPYVYFFYDQSLGYRNSSAGGYGCYSSCGPNITFSPGGIGGGGGGAGAVPEPASWALMIAGFGLIGSALRRRTAVLAA